MLAVQFKVWNIIYLCIQCLFMRAYTITICVGVLWGAIVLSHEVENSLYRWSIRVIAFSISAVAFGLAAAKLPTMNPNPALLEYFQANDDWGNFVK